MHVPPAQVLTIAGSDSSGGAGIQADLKTFMALGCYGASVITAITAQNTCGVQQAQALSAELVVGQLQAVLQDLNIRAIKTGMLANRAIIQAIAPLLQQAAIPLVLDPVMLAKSGHALLAEDAIEAFCQLLLPQAQLITPNLPEAAALCQRAEPDNEDEMQELAAALLLRGAKAVLLKGGHLAGPEAVDWFTDGQHWQRFASPRIATRNSHGTGCTLAAAICAGLGQGLPLLAAIEQAKRYLQQALAQADALAVGQGHGPLHHAHAWWPLPATAPTL
ncbi:bifunctional hydroxymethylpyrimidine kinase/phosphomethylpyrimidine kinase [Balneatrix alpica]|uniref:hydroxymethylpyrimidine kinase n=1 Tax=Balneatrix alpica TaxID=75684 RepID=A0ABV5ZAY0_9GAMM|nr:bifunctional hydroxymethylpyrimidine kinase/phosphomethylpyrimidine kinase [Balneatrix alpica]